MYNNRAQMSSPLARALPGLYLLSLGVLTLSRPAHPLSCPCRPAGVSPFPPTERETDTSLGSRSLAAYICFYKNPLPRTLPVLSLSYTDAPKYATRSLKSVSCRPYVSQHDPFTKQNKDLTRTSL